MSNAIRLIFAAALTAVVSVSSVMAQSPVAPPAPTTVPDKAQLEKRLESVKALLETSSAAKQVKANSDPQVKAEYAKALELWQEAKTAHAAGDLAKAQQLLLEAPKMLFAAARHSAPEQVTGDKLKQDYANRRDSVKALLDAQKRISSEKGNVAGAEQVAANVQKMLNDAEEMAKSGKYAEAKAEADKAYLLAKASVGQMRSGDTLVRSLNFANKEEEYKYEHDRNDSLTMLYKVLVEQKGTPSSMVLDSFKKGQELRGQAENSAAGGDHAGGVKLLEESTSQFIRAIRGAGVFIPG